MRNKTGIFCMFLGALLVLGAMFLFLWNEKESKDAGSYSENVMPAIQDEIQQAMETTPEQSDINENVPVELLTEEELFMTEKVINGYAYIGYLTIPDLNLELPIMSGWDNTRLQISPCRYSGTVKGEDLVIMAHNFKSHFGYLNTLTEGAKVQFVDMDGMVWQYQVVAKDILAAEAVEDMTAGEYDLTLFTCTTNRTNRITIRCDKVTE